MKPILNNKNRLVWIITGICLATLFNSCVKDDKSCIASRGGGANNVFITPTFNGIAFSGNDNVVDTVFIKYGSSVFPGTNPKKYDEIIVSIEDRNNVAIRRLSCGIFYFWVVSQDTVTGNRITGGASFITDKINGTYQISVPLKAQ
ncbi:MAG: hypothetical protein IPN13_20700 [Bacteroidetes bacterium]|nr:hypothetical protein [Bacteroidota bacterium]